MFAILAPTVLATLLAGCVTDEHGTPAEHDMLQFQARLELPFVGDSALSGATVMVDDALGHRAQLVTDQDGQATMMVNWQHGPFDLTIDPGIEGQPLVSILGIDMPDRHVQWTWTDRAPAADWSTLVGVVDDHDPDATLKVMAYGAGNGKFEGQPLFGLYGMQLLENEPFDLLALDIYEEWAGDTLYRDMARWTVVEHDGISCDTRYDLDLIDFLADGPQWQVIGQPDKDEEIWPSLVARTADVPEPDALPVSDFPRVYTPEHPVVTSGTFRLPADASDPLRTGGSGDVTVYCSVEGQPQECGWSTWIARDDLHARYAFFAQHMMPDITDALSTRVVATNGDNGAATMVRGAPNAWEAVPELLPVPEFSATDTADVAMEHWSVVLRYVDLPDDARYGLTLENEDGDTLWLVRGTHDRLVELPAPPSTVDVADLRAEVDAIRPWLTLGDDTVTTSTSWAQRHVVRQP